jgi:hypothetical protein
MKADIDANGVLHVHAETPMESFALGVWCEKYLPQNFETSVELLATHIIAHFPPHPEPPASR